jgi:hypothetical protein
MPALETQERLLNEISQLASSIQKLADAMALGAESEPPLEDLNPQPLPPEETLEAAGQLVFLGSEVDQCSGVLSVMNRQNQFVAIPRGQWTPVDVAINGSGHWFWRCGNTLEKSRGGLNFRQRVKHLKVFHSTSSRKITWHCFDVLS